MYWVSCSAAVSSHTDRCCLHRSAHLQIRYFSSHLKGSSQCMFPVHSVMQLYLSLIMHWKWEQCDGEGFPQSLSNALWTLPGHHNPRCPSAAQIVCLEMAGKQKDALPDLRLSDLRHSLRKIFRGRMFGRNPERPSSPAALWASSIGTLPLSDQHCPLYKSSFKRKAVSQCVLLFFIR